MADHTAARRGPEPPDLSEKGGNKEGQPQHSNERLFMQFLAFGGCASTGPLANALDRAKIAGVLYEDVNDPRGVGVLTFNEDPDYFLDRVRPVLNGPGFSVLVQKPEYTMLGRTYSTGQAFIDSGQGHVHIGRNLSQSQNLELVATYFDVPPGGAFRIDAADPGNCGP